MTLPSGFIDMLHSLLNEEAPLLIDALMQPPVTAVRLNSRKPGALFPDAIPVKWCATGFYLPERPVFTLDPLLHAGAYYVQDASSMIHREVISRLLGTPGPPISLLDLCAAPGGKTTAMIDALPDGSRVVANEYVAKRAAILKENLAKWGYPLAQVTNRDSSFFAKSGDAFDIVAVDAPCSGEGMMRKDEDAVKQWSLSLVKQCASLQREIVSNAVEALKPGGYLIYSTCTFNRMENEEVAEFIHECLGLQPVDMEFPEDWGIPRGIGTTLPVYRFMPHVTLGEGLFLAIFRKPLVEGDNSSHSLEPTISLSAIKGDNGNIEKDNMTVRPDHPDCCRSDKRESYCSRRSTSDSKRDGKKISKRVEKSRNDSFKKDSFKDDLPEIEEILSVDFDRSRYPEADVDKTTAIAYLQREAITLPPDTPKGPVVITYKGLPLGMAKNIGSRANNLYPKGWRILMRQ